MNMYQTTGNRKKSHLKEERLPVLPSDSGVNIVWKSGPVVLDFLRVTVGDRIIGELPVVFALEHVERSIRTEDGVDLGVTEIPIVGPLWPVRRPGWPRRLVRFILFLVFSCGPFNNNNIPVKISWQN